MRSDVDKNVLYLILTRDGLSLGSSIFFIIATWNVLNNIYFVKAATDIS